MLKNTVRRALFSLLFSWGDRYHCVFCGKSYSRFLPSGTRRAVFAKYDVVGVGRRANARCPNCFSKDRARLLLLYLRERTDLFEQPKRLLHVAPDEHLARAFAAATNIDCVYGALEVAKFGGRSQLRFDVQNLPFGDARFDVVLCNHVMEYVPQDERALREIRRVLRPGGFAILQVPLALALEKTYEVPGLEIGRQTTIEHYGHAYNLRIYGLDYADKLRRAGFTVEQHNPFRQHWLPRIERHGLDPREDVFVAIRPPRRPEVR